MKFAGLSSWLASHSLLAVWCLDGTLPTLYFTIDHPSGSSWSLSGTLLSRSTPYSPKDGPHVPHRYIALAHYA